MLWVNRGKIITSQFTSFNPVDQSFDVHFSTVMVYDVTFQFSNQAKEHIPSLCPSMHIYKQLTLTTFLYRTGTNYHIRRIQRLKNKSTF